jgi:hypothetical protein
MKQVIRHAAKDVAQIALPVPQTIECGILDCFTRPRKRSKRAWRREKQKLGANHLQHLEDA